MYEFMDVIRKQQILQKELLTQYIKMSSGKYLKDTTIYSTGKMIFYICEMYDLVVMNGRMKGVRAGDFMYIGGRCIYDRFML